MNDDKLLLWSPDYRGGIFSVSRHHDRGTPFRYTIVEKRGKAFVCGDKEVVPRGRQFRTVRAAMAWCQRNDDKE